MGFRCDLAPVTTFVYRADLGRGLVEHELDHVFVGRTAETPNPDETEVGSWRWVEVAELRRWMQERPEEFTAWFPEVLEALPAD